MTNTHEVTVLNGTLDVTWRAHQEHIFYVAEETLAGTIILTPRTGIPARRRQPIPQLTAEEQMDEDNGEKWS